MLSKDEFVYRKGEHRTAATLRWRQLRAAFYDWFVEHCNDEIPPRYCDIGALFNVSTQTAGDWVNYLGGFIKLPKEERATRAVIRYLETTEGNVKDATLLELPVDAPSKTSLHKVIKNVRERRPELALRILVTTPLTKYSKDRAAIIEAWLKEHPKATYSDLVAALGINPKSARRILAEHWRPQTEAAAAYLRENPAATAAELAHRFGFGIERARRVLAGAAPTDARNGGYISLTYKAYEANPGGGVKGIVAATHLPYETVTRAVRSLIDDGLIPHDYLTCDPLQLHKAYKQFINDWETAPEEMFDVTVVDACYMYNVELADIRKFEAQSGRRLRSRARDLKELKDETSAFPIERACDIIRDATDRKASVAELMAVCRISRDAVEKTLDAAPYLATRVARNFKPEVISYNGELPEALGEFNPPEEWVIETRKRGGLGIILTGGYWRRYFELWQTKRLPINDKENDENEKDHEEATSKTETEEAHASQRYS